MTSRRWVLALCASLLALSPAGVRAAEPPAPAAADSARATSPADSSRAGGTVDTLRVPLGSPLRRYESSVVRVPVGSTPLDEADTTAARPPARRRGSSSPDTRIALLLGLGFPVAPSELAKGWNPGGQFGAAMDFGHRPHFLMRLRGDWVQLPFDERHFLRSVGLYGTGAAVEGGDASLVMLSATPRFHTLGRRPRWYVEAGPGFGMMRWGDALLYDPVNAELYENPSDEEFRGGLTAGIGFEILRRDGSGLFMDLHWNALFTRDHLTQYIPLSIGLLFP